MAAYINIDILRNGYRYEPYSFGDEMVQMSAETLLIRGAFNIVHTF